MTMYPLNLKVKCDDLWLEPSLMIWQSNLKDFLFLVCKTVYFRKTIKFAQYIGRRSVNCNKIRESMISCVGFFFLDGW